MTLDKDKNGALGISIAGGLGSPIGDRPVIIAYAQGQAASKVSVSKFALIKVAVTEANLCSESSKINCSLL